MTTGDGPGTTGTARSPGTLRPANGKRQPATGDGPWATGPGGNRRETGDGPTGPRTTGQVPSARNLTTGDGPGTTGTARSPGTLRPANGNRRPATVHGRRGLAATDGARGERRQATGQARHLVTGAGPGAMAEGRRPTANPRQAGRVLGDGRRTTGGVRGAADDRQPAAEDRPRPTGDSRPAARGRASVAGGWGRCRNPDGPAHWWGPGGGGPVGDVPILEAARLRRPR